jgi:chromosomal replication initiator protein
MTVENIAPIFNPKTEKVEVSPESVLFAVVDEFKVSMEELKGNSRRREISTARQVAMYLMRHHTDLSLPKIGEVFGGKDHTTVLYSCDKISQLKNTDPNLAQMLRQLSDQINGVSRL